MEQVICPYCNAEAKQVNGEVIYPHRPDLAAKLFYLCRPCWAYVGCHQTPDRHGEPFGTLADEETRMYRSELHAHLDPLWIDGPKRGRRKRRVFVYKWLSEQLHLPENETHVGLFDVATCKAALNAIMDGDPWE